MTANNESDFCWIVDPLDGTLNYVHQLPSWSVSVALQYRQKVIAAAVFDPWLDELYSATADGSATLNGEPLQTSGCVDPRQSLLVVSLPARLTAESPEFSDMVRLMCATRSMRRLGSAALNLCYLAAGRIDAYWATSLNLWDVAGGWLIMQQAGGAIRNPAGGPFDPRRPRLLAAASDSLADQLVDILD